MPDKSPTLRIRPEIDALEDSRIVQVWKLGFEVPDVIGTLGRRGRSADAGLHLRCRRGVPQEGQHLLYP